MSEIKLREITLKDKLLIYNWFNEKDSIRYKIKTQNKISLRNHVIWFNKFIKNNLGNIWIIIYNNYEIGNIRLNLIKANKYEIDIYIIKKFRRLNLASKSLLLLENKLSQDTIIYSYIKKNNFRSLKFFIKNNYKVFSASKGVWFLKKKI